MRASNLNEKETLMVFNQPQRRQSTKITVRFIHSITIRNLMKDNLNFLNDLKYISSPRALVPWWQNYYME